MLVQIEMRGPSGLRRPECSVTLCHPQAQAVVTLARDTTVDASEPECELRTQSSTCWRRDVLHLSPFLDMSVTDSASFLQSEIFENNKIVS